MQGRVKLHRKMIDWERYDDINTKVLFLHLLLTVNHKDKKWRGTIIPKGSTVKTLVTLSEETGLTVRQIRTCLSKLKSTGELTQSKLGKYGLISINLYDNYQQNDTNNVTEMTTYGQRNDTQTTLNKNDKNIKNDKNDIKVDYDLYQQLRNKGIDFVSKRRQSRKLNDKTKKLIKEIDQDYGIEDFKLSVNNYIGDCRNRKEDRDGYYLHRFTFGEFLQRQGGFYKFLNY